MASRDDTEMDIDLLAAALRADAGDVAAFVEALAVKLEAAVPGAVRVERRRDGLFGPKLVRGICIDAGGRRLELRATGGGVQTYCSRLSGGIVLKSEQVDIDAWLQALGQALAAQAQHSESTRQALERLLDA